MTDFDADLIAARNAMLARELPDMHWANDFNDNIGVPRVSDKLNRLSISATQGEWQARANALGADIYAHERGYVGSFTSNNLPMPHTEARMKADAAFVATLVNAYRAGDLVPASQLAEARNEGKRQAEAEVGKLRLQNVDTVQQFNEALDAACDAILSTLEETQ